MVQSVDFYYDYGSPTAYLAWTQLPSICAKYGATLRYKPVLLGGVFKATGNNTPVVIEPKGKWLFDDIERYAHYYGVPYQKNPFFIVNSMAMMRGAIWAQENDVLPDYNNAMYEATWAHGKDTANPEVIRAVMLEAALDADAMAQAVTQDWVKKRLIDATQASVEQGVFGVPSMIVAGQLHFGQDRLEWIERVLKESN